MGTETAIGWTHHTFNPWRGCTKVAPGCTHCYADALAKRNPKVLGVWGPAGTRVVAAESHWRLPLKWDREAVKAGERRCVFCASLGDVFEDWEGLMTDHLGHVLKYDGEEFYANTITDGPDCATMHDVRRRLFRLIGATPNLDWLLLTKQPENIPRMWTTPSAELMARNVRDGIHGSHRPNVWLLTSVSEQATALRNIPLLLECRDLAPVLGVSVEPLLGEVDLGEWLPRLDWVIVGGESGPNRRPCNVAWIESIVQQCRDAGVACFVKQDAARQPGQQGRLSDDVWGVKEFPREKGG